jgi:hypothetical protein
VYFEQEIKMSNPVSEQEIKASIYYLQDAGGKYYKKDGNPIIFATIEQSYKYLEQQDYTKINEDDYPYYVDNKNNHYYVKCHIISVLKWKDDIEQPE